MTGVYIILGYLVMVAAFGPIGAIAATIHMGVLLAITRLSKRRRP